MLLESVVEETLTEFISAGHVRNIATDTGRRTRQARGGARATLSRCARAGTSSKTSALEHKAAESHSREADHTAALAELSQAMNGSWRVRRTTPSTGELIRPKSAREWARLAAKAANHSYARGPR